MPGGGIHLRSVRALEQELQCELNQPRVVGLRSDCSKSVIVGLSYAGAGDQTRRVIAVVPCAGESELNAIEGVEEFRPELNPKPVFRAEGRCLE